MDLLQRLHNDEVVGEHQESTNERACYTLYIHVHVYVRNYVCIKCNVNIDTALLYIFFLI